MFLLRHQSVKTYKKNSLSLKWTFVIQDEKSSPKFISLMVSLGLPCQYNLFIVMSVVFSFLAK